MMEDVLHHYLKTVPGANRGAKHTVPDKQRDVDLLRAKYAAGKVHEVCPGRTFKRPEDSPKDVVGEGYSQVLFNKKVVGEWWPKYRAHAKRSKEQVFPPAPVPSAHQSPPEGPNDEELEEDVEETAAEAIQELFRVRD